MFFLYNILLTLLSPIWAVWLLMRARRRKEGPNWNERLGQYEIKPRMDRKRIWIHAVSVGEVIAARPVLEELRTLLPDYELVLSVTTSSGHQTARESKPGLYDHLFYFPIDILRFTLGAVQRVQPAVVAIMETELWMNFLWSAKTFECRTMLINGRISDRSLNRARWVQFFYEAMLKNVDRCLMQTEESAERIKFLGAKQAEVFGSTKFDQAQEVLSASRTEERAKFGVSNDDFLIVVGSTRSEMEETLVLDALQGLKVKVIHAPRHMERAEALASAANQKLGQVALRSKGQTGDYLILDTYGELATAYAAADLAIVGGAFDKLGGQNLIQALAAGVPVLHGPNMQNFREAAEMAAQARATTVCESAGDLRAAIEGLMADYAERQRMGQAGRALVEAHQGAARRYAQAIAEEAAKVPERKPRKAERPG